MTRPTKHPQVCHADAAQRMQRSPGKWLYVTTHPARYSAQATASRISGAHYAPYAPAGTFEARTEPTEFETAVYARYVGNTAQNGSTA